MNVAIVCENSQLIQTEIAEEKGKGRHTRFFCAGQDWLNKKLSNFKNIYLMEKLPE